MADTVRYEALMDVVRHRMTNRAFQPSEVPREHVEMILESARHAPSGANAIKTARHKVMYRDESKVD